MLRSARKESGYGICHVMMQVKFEVSWFMDTDGTDEAGDAVLPCWFTIYLFE